MAMTEKEQHKTRKRTMRSATHALVLQFATSSVPDEDEWDENTYFSSSGPVEVNSQVLLDAVRDYLLQGEEEITVEVDGRPVRCRWETCWTVRPMNLTSRPKA
jgi:hypothetical protein